MRTPWITACCMLLGCAAQAPEPDLSRSENETALTPSPALTAEPREAAAPEAETSGTATDATSVNQVAIESFAEVAICRRYVATGTRIAGKRCASNEQETQADRLEYEQTLRDVEAMRTQQIYQEQARQRAIEEEMRRRTGQ